MVAVFMFDEDEACFSMLYTTIVGHINDSSCCRRQDGNYFEISFRPILVEFFINIAMLRPCSIDEIVVKIDGVIMAICVAQVYFFLSFIVKITASDRDSYVPPKWRPKRQLKFGPCIADRLRELFCRVNLVPAGSDRADTNNQDETTTKALERHHDASSFCLCG